MRPLSGPYSRAIRPRWRILRDNVGILSAGNFYTSINAIMLPCWGNKGVTHSAADILEQHRNAGDDNGLFPFPFR